MPVDASSKPLTDKQFTIDARCDCWAAAAHAARSPNLFSSRCVGYRGAPALGFTGQPAATVTNTPPTAQAGLRNAFYQAADIPADWQLAHGFCSPRMNEVGPVLKNI